MAIASLHNVPVLESSILRESQSSTSSRQNGNQGRISTRPSSILQMWRELEDECVVHRAPERGSSRLQQESSDLEDLIGSDNGSVNDPESRIGSINENENEESQSRTSDQSQDFGEVERERVRQIFREWKNSGLSLRTPNSRSSRGQWLGENERERVRIVREWIQMTSQQREACVGNRDEQAVEIGSRIERVRDGEVLDRNVGQVENRRREIRRLCGRQALLDLLAKKEQERRIELQSLQAARPVSSFSQRNRIQSLLRLRCFQNTRLAESNRSTSAAESELGLLRQRQTVSGLREGFLSRLDNSVHIQATNPADGPSNNNVDGLREHPMQANSATEVLACRSDQNDRNGDDNVSSSADLSQSSGSIIGGSDSQELVTQVEERLDHTLDIQIEQTAPPFENRVLNSEEPLRSESGEFSDFEQSSEMHLQQYDNREEINGFNQSDNLEGDVSEDVNGQGSSLHVEEWRQQVVEFEEAQWEGTVSSNHWRDDDQIETDIQHWSGDAEESSHGALENDAGVQNDAPEDYWHENGSQETPRDWLEMPYGHEASSSGRVDMYYLSDDDNLHNLELRELLNRRRVSSLLHSGFRENLDQLIRSYVERQTQASDDLEVHEMSSPAFASRDHLDEVAAAEVSQQVAPPPPPPPQPQRPQVLHHANWFTHERQHPGTEWETINDLRIDLGRLQQRLNNMQRMLEACMDMQLELQRSVRQEVSAALNRSINPSESLENILPKDSFNWDCVKKGICCLCSDDNIDTLLYRCGHMCTCTKCANTLLQGNGKCPMCQAPVIEVIRAYFIQ